MNNFIDLQKTKQKRITLYNPGSYIIFFFNYSGQLTVEIENKDIEVNLLGIYIGKNSKEFNLETKQHHKVGGNSSNLLVKGIFFAESQFDFQGFIKIDINAQKSHAYQKNQNLILGSNASVSSKPFLEIEANDVFCTHGSTTGKLSEIQLNYLENRGINKKKGEKLLIHGFVSEVFDIMKTSKVESKIIEYYKNSVENLLKYN